MKLMVCATAWKKAISIEVLDQQQMHGDSKESHVYQYREIRVLNYFYEDT